MVGSSEVKVVVVDVGAVIVAASIRIVGGPTSVAEKLISSIEILVLNSTWVGVSTSHPIWKN